MCVCVCIFPLPVEIHRVSIDISLEFITLWVKALGKINMQRAEGESSVLLSFLCYTFRFINSSKNTFYPYKICCPRGFFFFFKKKRKTDFSDCFWWWWLKLYWSFANPNPGCLYIRSNLSFFFFFLTGIGRQTEMVSFLILKRAPGGSERDAAALNKVMM